jgi:hypothetical protein
MWWYFLQSIQYKGTELYDHGLLKGLGQVPNTVFLGENKQIDNSYRSSSGGLLRKAGSIE